MEGSKRTTSRTIKKQAKEQKKIPLYDRKLVVQQYIKSL